MPVRVATDDDLLSVMRLIDAALLDLDPDDVRRRLRSDDILVFDDGSPPAGALVLEGETVRAIAVRPNRRDRGIGRRLVTAARERRGPLAAEFDGRVKPFYESLGFDIQPVDGAADRYRGTLE